MQLALEILKLPFVFTVIGSLALLNKVTCFPCCQPLTTRPATVRDELLQTTDMPVTEEGDSLASSSTNRTNFPLTAGLQLLQHNFHTVCHFRTRYAPLLVTVSASPPLFNKVTLSPVAARPATFASQRYEQLLGLQTTLMFETSATTPAPLAFNTVQIFCIGRVATVTV
jgi:hypothetical protein